MLLLPPSLATAENSSNSESHSIYFMALPYLNSFHYDRNKQPNIAPHLKSTQDLSDYNWTISITSIPDLITSSGAVQTLDTDQMTRYRLADDLKHIIIPIPEKTKLLLPAHGLSSATAPLWLQYIKSKETSWHSPRLTPAIAAQVLAAKKEAQRLSKHMAERAFYFGYDTNEDALE